jgi:hypothetical protein
VKTSNALAKETPKSAAKPSELARHLYREPLETSGTQHHDRQWREEDRDLNERCEGKGCDRCNICHCKGDQR